MQNSRANSGAGLSGCSLAGTVALVLVMTAALLFWSGCSQPRFLTPRELLKSAPRPRPATVLGIEYLSRSMTHAIFIEMSRNSRQALVLEMCREGGAYFYGGFAWGFLGGRYLAHSRDDGAIRLRELSDSERERLEDLLRELPRSQLGQRLGSGDWLDGCSVFVWGRIGNTVVQGFKQNPDTEEETEEYKRAGFTKLPDDRWLTKALALFRALARARPEPSSASDQDGLFSTP